MSRYYPRSQLLLGCRKYDAMSRCCRMVSSCCLRIDCLMIGVLWVTNSCSCWVDLAKSSDSGSERITLSDARILSWQEYNALTLS